MNTFCLLTIVVISQVYTPAKINQIRHFKWIQTTVWILWLNEVLRNKAGSGGLNFQKDGR